MSRLFGRVPEPTRKRLVVTPLRLGGDRITYRTNTELLLEVIPPSQLTLVSDTLFPTRGRECGENANRSCEAATRHGVLWKASERGTKIVLI